MARNDRAPTYPPAQAASRERDRGRNASEPSDIPAKGWWDVLWRVKGQVSDDNVSIVSAGLALFGLLAIFPALAAIVGIYGLFVSPEQIGAQLEPFSGVLPGAGREIIEGQLANLANQRNATLGAGVIVGILIALWSARKGMVAFMTAVNVAYNEKEERGFFRQLFVSLGLTVGAVAGFLLMLALGVLLPLALRLLPLGSAMETVVLLARWALLWLVAAVGFSILYRFAPDRRPAQWKWVSWGSGIAATLWIASSLVFALYVRNADAYGQTYGALGGIVIMLMWFYISAFVIMLGAEINSELERQTLEDTSSGQPRPLGARQAYSADTVGPPAGK